MRLITLGKLLVLGGGITAIVLHQRRKAARADDYMIDRRDPVQAIGIDEAELADLDVDAVADRDVALDLAALELEPFTRDRDHGSLYGARLPVMEAELVEEDAAYSRGQNWVEALETKSIEDGGEPGRELLIEDDYEVDLATSPRIDTRDLPVADRGSAGPRGV